MIRIARISRLYKLVKLTKLLRILKIIRDQSKFFRQINEYFKIGPGMDRMVFFIIIFFLSIHSGTCFWLIIARYNSDSDIGYNGTWVEPFYNDYGSSAS